MREEESLDLYWGDGFDWVTGRFTWDSGAGHWTGALAEGTEAVGSGHWRAEARLVPIDCPSDSAG